MNNKKSITKNFIYNSLYTALNIMFPIITLPYISRILEADYLGKVNYAINIITWFLTFASMGIQRYGVREISRVKFNKIKMSKVFNELFFINFIMTVVCMCVYLVVINNVRYFVDNKILFLVIGIQLVLNIFNVDWFYQGIEEFGYITARSFIIKIISLFSIFIIVKEKTDYILYVLILTLAMAGNYLFNSIHLKKYISINFYNLKIKKHIKALLFIAFAQLSVSVYALLDTTILGYICSETTVGYYTNSQKIIKAVASLCAALGTVLFPKFVELFYENDILKIESIVVKVVNLILWMCFPICVMIIILSKDIVLVMFGSDFAKSIVTIRILAPFILITTLGNIFGMQLLITLGEEKNLLKSVLIGTIVSVGANLFLIPRYQHNGAAFVSVFVELIVMLIQLSVCQRYIRIRFNVRFIIKIILQIIFMVICMIPIVNFFNNSILTMIFGSFFGCSSYLLVGYFLKNSIQMDILKKIKSEFFVRIKNKNE